MPDHRTMNEVYDSMGRFADALAKDRPARNTVLFVDQKGNSCHITADGSLGIEVGGSVATLPLDQWFMCMREVFPKP